MTNDTLYMRNYMRKYRADRALAPKTIKKECVNCGKIYYVLEEGTGRSKYCLDCKLLAIDGKLTK